MNFYTLAAKEERWIAREADRNRSKMNTNIFDDSTNEVAIQEAEQAADLKFEKTYRRAVKRMLMARAINEELGLTAPKGDKGYMITIRPENNKITLKHFYNRVAGFVDRACFITYSLSFEQKGITDETLGTGFHVHIIAEMKQRSKGEVLRDTISTFKDCTAAHCIQVDPCKNMDDTINNYLVEYKSKDNHKEETKHWDTIWRAKHDLLSLYKNNCYKWDAEERAYQVRSGTTIVEIQ